MHVIDVNRTIFILGEIDDDLLKDVLKQMLSLGQTSKDPIHVFINSQGGQVDEGFALIDIMESLPCEVYTYACGDCQSMAADIFISGTKGKRYIYKNSFVMMHRMKAGASGTVENIQSMNDFYTKTNNVLRQRIQTLTRIPEDLIEKIMTYNEYYFTAQECIEYGIADHIVDKINI